MPRSPSIEDADHDTYLVLLGAFGGWLGRAWREIGREQYTYRETLIRDLLDGVYTDPVRIVAFNSAEGWSRDVTTEIAAELRQCYAKGEDLPRSIQHLLEMARQR
ncbi:hypothetical protein Q2941_40465 [Bradyrhizobium sp. UFLA05-153]